MADIIVPTNYNATAKTASKLNIYIKYQFVNSFKT